MGGYLRIRTALDVDCFRSALATLVARHDALRICLVPDRELPQQIFAAPLTPQIEIVDLTAEPNPDAAAHGRMRASLDRPFDWFGAALRVRAAEARRERVVLASEVSPRHS